MRTVAEPLGLDIADAASGVIHVITMRMAQLINEMTVQTGLDPRHYWLVGFGGAGPLFVAALSAEIEALGALVPPYPAVWSAFGGLYADVVHGLRPLAPAPASRPRRGRRGTDRTALLGCSSSRSRRRRAFARERPDRARLRRSLQGTVPSSPGSRRPLSQGLTRSSLDEVETRFEAMHQAMYGHTRPGDPQQLRDGAVPCPRRANAPCSAVGAVRLFRGGRGRRSVPSTSTAKKRPSQRPSTTDRTWLPKPGSTVR